jgi:predicted nucleotidyltransferase
MITMDALQGEKRRDVIRLAAAHGAKNIRVFGSVARGESSPTSDLDLLVEWEDGRTLLDHVALVQDLEELLGTKVHAGDRAGAALARARPNTSRGTAAVKDDRLYLHHMLERCERISRFIEPGKEHFMHSEAIQDAVIRNIGDWRSRQTRLGCYANELPELEEVWSIASLRIPELRLALERFLAG